MGEADGDKEECAGGLMGWRLFCLFYPPLFVAFYLSFLSAIFYVLDR